MNDDRIYRIIGRQLSGQASQAENRELEIWLAKNEHNKLIFQALREYWLSESAQNPNKEKVLQRLYKRMDESREEVKSVTRKEHVKRGPTPTYLYRVAAVLVFLLIFLPWFIYNNLANRHKGEFEAINKMIEKVVPYGQKSTIRLSDGSIVKLNAGSKLSYPSQFNESSREVYLEGEAFFEIRKEENRPFLVISDDVVTTVLGTSFNIKAHQEENLIKVALVTGKVKVSVRSRNEDQFDYTLTPNEMLTYHKERRTSKKDYFNASEALAWKDQTLFFANASLKEMTTVLQRWYGKEFVINNGNTITRKFSGKFENNRSLEYVLNVLSLNANFNYRIVDDTVFIEGEL